MSWARRVRRVLIGVLLVALLGAAVLWRMTRLAPAWYQPPAPDDPRAQAIAEEVEYRLLEQVQQLRADDAEPWARRLREEQINAWLATRLRAWIEHEHGGQWPGALGVPQVRFLENELAIALPLRDNGAMRTVDLRLRPTLDVDGLRLVLTRISLGRVGLPGDPVLTLAQRAGQLAPGLVEEPAAQAALEILAGRRAIDPVFELSDGRQIRVTQLDFRPGLVDVTAQAASAQLAD